MGSLFFSSLIFFFFFFLFVGSAQGGLFSKLPRTLIVSASPKKGQVLKVGVDNLTVTRALNGSLPASADVTYKKVKLRLCYAPVSQKDRGWRKTMDDLDKDKTCQFGITIKPYTKSNKTTSYNYLVERDVPIATYFIRAYALDSSDNIVAFGQTTDPHKTTNLFQIVGITGRHASLDIAAGCFSAFSIVSLLFFFVLEKKKTKK